ncbi:hypothetical protein SAMN05444407_108224 [Chryseobacterium contaminans]|uniref:Uncharacterized protein n=1 Tax=Chryseobacterium contaminans TaxID=1423959 RepID=A0A1M7FFK7_9FLAO|nr:hypothetical protein SAMN05444407_108224 [Chryseobacterium contaminans]
MNNEKFTFYPSENKPVKKSMLTLLITNFLL